MNGSPLIVTGKQLNLTLSFHSSHGIALSLHMLFLTHSLTYISVTLQLLCTPPFR